MNTEDVVKLKLIAQIELELRKMSEDNINVIKDVVDKLVAEQASETVPEAQPSSLESSLIGADNGE